MQNEHFEKFTKNAKLSLTAAQKAARAMGEAYIGTEHILVGLVSNPEALAAEILEGHAVTLEKVQLALSFSSKSRYDAGGAGLTDPAKKVIEKAVATAARHQHYYVGTEHLLLGILGDKNTKAYSILEELGADPERIKSQVLNLFRHTGSTASGAGAATPGQPNGGQPVTPGGGTIKKQKADKDKTPALDYFSTDLTDLAKQNKLDPVIGRDDEVQRVIQILGRRTKNNPVLIGEPGIGKTAIVEGLAERIIEERVPDALHGKRVLALDLPLMVAGTKYRGEFEERVKQVIEELKKLDDIVLFIDELHTIVGAGAAEGSMDAAQILKPSLARGEIQTVGATTLDEYRKHIEKDAALERRFQPVHVKEPSEEETVAVLKGLRKNYEDHHGVEITDEAIETAVRLSTRYIADRFLPDKAIDLVDEAASAGRLREGGLTPELKKLQEELTAMNSEKERAIDNQDYEKAAQLRDKANKIREQLRGKGPKTVKVQSEDIATVVAQWTGVPVTRLVKAEAENLTNLEKKLKQQIIGQDEAVSAVSRSIRRSRVGIGNPKRPMGSFIFLGPTGVGKTELVKVLAREVFGAEDNLIKLDMSEFMERHNVSRLVGAPAGYVGYEEGGKLTEQIRRNPYSVILLDEVEKAHPEVFNLLLQILEDGQLTDAKGRKVDFRNAIIILTSNVGASELQKTAQLGFRVTDDASEASLEQRYEEMKQRVLEQLKDKFKPEFLNRLDQIVVFKPLTKELVGKIVDLQLTEFAGRLKEHDLKISVDAKAKAALIERGFDPQYGARPVRRAIQNDIEDPLAEKLLSGEIKDGARVRIGFEKDAFTFTASRAAKRTPAKK
ncbi:MAG: ATP-dependent Clp protease ATP-binding subunit [bacterium]|nr:ATP-dependent Clp protease ATP-binding subunit [bacterium]MDZ4247769.1 ATP-dependent Clp protease ATP-binding subunit [Patescibacteria group bacterium]